MIGFSIRLPHDPLPVKTHNSLDLMNRPALNQRLFDEFLSVIA
jgi:hypothetical protein